ASACKMVASEAPPATSPAGRSCSSGEVEGIRYDPFVPTPYAPGGRARLGIGSTLSGKFLWPRPLDRKNMPLASSDGSSVVNLRRKLRVTLTRGPLPVLPQKRTNLAGGRRTQPMYQMLSMPNSIAMDCCAIGLG